MTYDRHAAKEKEIPYKENYSFFLRPPETQSSGTGHSGLSGECRIDNQAFTERLLSSMRKRSAKSFQLADRIPSIRLGTLPT